MKDYFCIRFTQEKQWKITTTYQTTAFSSKSSKFCNSLWETSSYLHVLHFITLIYNFMFLVKNLKSKTCISLARPMQKHIKKDNDISLRNSVIRVAPSILFTTYQPFQSTGRLKRRTSSIHSFESWNKCHPQVRNKTLQPERHFDQQLSVAPYWAYIWENKAQSQLLIPWDSEHIPVEAFDLWSASGQLTPDTLHTYMHTLERICTYMSISLWLITC